MALTTRSFAESGLCASSKRSVAFERKQRASRGSRMVICAAQQSGPKRVAIIGSGVGGLAAAVALLRMDTGVEEIKVFEKHPELKPNLGAAFNVNGGAAILARLGLMEELKEISNVPLRVRGRSVEGSDLLGFRLEDAHDTFAGTPSPLRHEGELCFFTVMRSDLQQMLASQLPDGTIHLGKQLSALTSTSGGTEVKFEDGTSETFDLVIGADGIKSRMRELMFGSGSPSYSNIRIQFGVCPPEMGPRTPEERQELHQWFGDGTYGLVYTAGPEGKRQDMIALVRQESGSVGENADWEASEIQQDCVRRLQEGRFPSSVQAVAQSCERFFDIGVYYHDTLPSWSNKEGTQVLLGDSAHAMPPFLGQGANQAIQDAYSLAEKLSSVGTKYQTTGEALKAYEKTRNPPTAAIMQSSRFLGALETQGGPGALIRNSLFYMTGKLRIAEKVFIDGANIRV